MAYKYFFIILLILACSSPSPAYSVRVSRIDVLDLDDMIKENNQSIKYVNSTGSNIPRDAMLILSHFDTLLVMTRHYAVNYLEILDKYLENSGKKEHDNYSKMLELQKESFHFFIAEVAIPKTDELIEANQVHYIEKNRFSTHTSTTGLLKQFSKFIRGLGIKSPQEEEIKKDMQFLKDITS